MAKLHLPGLQCVFLVICYSILGNNAATLTNDCFGSFCETKNYPLGKIIEAVDRLQKALNNDIWIEAFDNKTFRDDVFFTSKKSKLLASQSNKSIVIKDYEGCETKVRISFPQKARSESDNKTYYVVNVPKLQQGIKQYKCIKSNQSCTDTDSSVSSSNSCQQQYREEEFVVLPMGKRHFSIEDFDVKRFHMLNDCSCASN